MKLMPADCITSARALKICCLARGAGDVSVSDRDGIYLCFIAGVFQVRARNSSNVEIIIEALTMVESRSDIWNVFFSF